MDEQQILIRIIEAGWAQCSTVIRQDGGVMITALLAGLVGSVTHCIGMCGPFVISQVTARMENVPLEKMREWRRLTGAALLPYHFGRLTTYTLMGILAGYFADAISALVQIVWLTPVLLILAALFFLIYGVTGLVPHLGLSQGKLQDQGGLSGKIGLWWNRLIGNRLRPLFAAPYGVRGYGLGIMLGFIPCGLIYGALMLAAAGGSALSGGFVMAAFGLGTVPMLVVTGMLGHFAAGRFRAVMTPVGRGLMIANAAVLAVLAYGQIA
ncbi:MAG: sulfite exporter TauE/SafE family protein [Pseudomonadota bacterium]